MLQEQTIPKETFRLLKTLMQDKELNDFDNNQLDSYA